MALSAMAYHEMSIRSSCSAALLAGLITTHAAYAEQQGLNQILADTAE